MMQKKVLGKKFKEFSEQNLLNLKNLVEKEHFTAGSFTYQFFKKMSYCQ